MSESERWTEPRMCEACAETCVKWDAEARTCYGRVGMIDEGSGGDPVYLHFCENPRHHPDFTGVPDRRS